MKGPGHRLKNQFRRMWECPVCHHKERTGGECSSLVCSCQQNLPLVEQQVMRLSDDSAPPKRWWTPSILPADATRLDLPPQSASPVETAPPTAEALPLAAAAAEESAPPAEAKRPAAGGEGFTGEASGTP